MRGTCGLVLAGLLAVVPLCALAWQPAAAEAAPGATHKNAAAMTRQRTEVQRLQKNVAAQESSSQAAAEKLKQRDAEIAELQRQLQAAQQAGKGH